MTPIDPDEARHLLLEELARGEYAPRRSLIERIMDLIGSWLDALTSANGSPTPVGTVVAIALALLAVAVAALIVRRTGLWRRRIDLRENTALAGDAQIAPEELRRRAGAAVEEGRHDDAVVLSLRAIVRDLSDRTLLDVTDGMTAHEAATGASRAFPQLRGRLVRTADAFDRAAYSRCGVTAKQAVDAVRFAEYLAQTAPDAEALAQL